MADYPRYHPVKNGEAGVFIVQTADLDSKSSSGRDTSRRLLLIPILHFACCLALVLCVTFLLNGYQAIPPTSPRYVSGELRLRVSDVTTLISASLTVIRLLVGAWTGTIVWNSLFILLQDRGLTLNEINRVTTFYLPPMPKRVTGFLVALLLLLVIPQQLIGPVLSGAVDWAPSFEYNPNPIQTQAGSPTANPTNWYWYYYNGPLRRATLRRASAFAALAWASSTGDRSHCRHIVNDDGFQINSTITNVLIPCIRIHSITFPASPPPTKVYSLVTNDMYNNGSNITRVDDAPMFYGEEGNAIAFDPDDLPGLYGGFPPETPGSFHREVGPHYPRTGFMTAVVLVNASASRKDQTCADLRESIFGARSFNNNFTPVDGGNYDRCMTYAVVNLTAGVAVSPRSTYITNRVIEADESDANMQISAGQWVHEAVYLMPDVMSMFGQMNTTPLATWDALETYTEKLMRYSYQAAWDALTRSFAPNVTNLGVNLYEPRQVATVSHVRLYVWSFVSLLLEVSCIVLLVFGKRCSERELVLDAPVAALLTDPPPVLDKMGRDLTNLAYVTSCMSKGMGKVTLRRRGVDSAGGHSLVPARDGDEGIAGG